MTTPHMTVSSEASTIQTDVRVAALSGDISTLYSRVDTTDDTVGDVQASLTSLESDLALRAPAPVATTAAIQSALTNAKANKFPPVVAEGDNLITSSLVTPYQIGGTMRGEGRGEALASDHPLRGLVSNLIWDGPLTEDTVATTYWNGSTAVASTRPANVLIVYRASEFSIENIALLGGTRAEQDAAQTRPHVCLLFHQDQGGIGTGGLTGQNLYIQYWKIGIQVATNLLENNCDTSAFYRVFFDRVNTCFYSKNTQSLSFSFDNVYAKFIDTIFLYEAGGDLEVNRLCVLSPCTILKFQNVTSGIGHNNFKWYFSTLQLDQAAGATKFLDYSGSVTIQSGEANFDGGLIQYKLYTTPAFIIPPGMRVVLRDIGNLQKNMFRWGGDCHIKMDNCMGWQHPSNSVQDVDSLEDLFDTENSTGTATITCNDCWQYSNGDDYPPFTSSGTYKASLVGEL